jgi:catechol 2,3-dioxygenase-like lactoylglutathione lyase family enzyme
MTVSALEHITIRCAQLRLTRDFYCRVLGLREGARPDFPFRGHWLYLEDVPVIHLVEAADTGGAGWAQEGRRAPPSPEDGTGAFDHVAFRGGDFEAMRARLTAAQAGFRERIVPGGTLRQLFVHDPEGVLVEINFRA